MSKPSNRAFPQHTDVWQLSLTDVTFLSCYPAYIL
ncbi:protein of unknown function [Candidatus Filomicrobium marinum]|nr:protein of unknown function [Candidatus Filomicrobium marinum]